METNVIMPLDTYERLKEKADKFDNGIMTIKFRGVNPLYYGQDLIINVDIYENEESKISEESKTQILDFVKKIQEFQLSRQNKDYQTQMGFKENEIYYLKSQINKIPEFIRSFFHLDRIVNSDRTRKHKNNA